MVITLFVIVTIFYPSQTLLAGHINLIEDFIVNVPGIIQVGQTALKVA